MQNKNLVSYKTHKDTTSDPDELKKANEELTTASYKIAEEMYKSGAAGAQQQGGAEAQKEKEDVVEAEFEETDKDKKE